MGAAGFSDYLILAQAVNRGAVALLRFGKELLRQPPSARP
jgi:hypothetical protein